MIITNLKQCSRYLHLFLFILLTVMVLTFVKYFVIGTFLTKQLATSDNLKTNYNLGSHSNENCNIMANNNILKFVNIEKSSSSFKKYQIVQTCDKNDDKVLSYQEVITLLRTEADFRNTFFDILRLGLNKIHTKDGKETSPAYFFEICPVTVKTFSSAQFEFVIIPAPALEGVSAEQRFEKYISCYITVLTANSREHT